MKALIIAVTLVGSHLAFAADTMNPKAPLLINCTDEAGTQTSVRVMKIYFDSKSGKAYGMNFGPNRGDEGFVVLTGSCEVAGRSAVNE